MTKREKESFIFSNFSKLLLGNKVSFSQPEPPEPDFVFTLNDKRIGCELTTIYVDNEPGEKGSAIRKNESIQKSICKRVQNWMTTNIPAFFEIHLNFNNKLIPDDRIILLSNKIIEIIESKISELNIEEFSYLKIDDYDTLPSELDYIFILTYPPLEKTYVSQAGGFFVPKLIRERVISNIVRKEKLLNNYSHLNDSNWLLLSINESCLSSEFDLLEETYQEISTRFDKVFLYSLRDQKIVTIK